MRIRLSDLIEAKVVTESGKKLGKVHDVRARRLERRNPDGYQLRIVALVLGSVGLGERLGLGTGKTGEPITPRDAIEWERVLKIDHERHQIVVRESAADES